MEAFFLGVAAILIFLRLMLFVRPGFPLVSFARASQKDTAVIPNAVQYSLGDSGFEF